MARKNSGKLFNTSYQQSIVFRMLDSDEKKMQEFHEDYCNNRNHTYGQRDIVPSKKDYEIAKMWQSGKPTREISQKFGMTQSKISSAINRVARYNFKN